MWQTPGKIPLLLISSFTMSSKPPIWMNLSSLSIIAQTHPFAKNKRLFGNFSSTATSTLNTTNGASDANFQSGQIKICWADGENLEHSYILDGVIYKPDSPFNVLSVARLGEHFERKDSPLFKMTMGLGCDLALFFDVFLGITLSTPEQFTTPLIGFQSFQ